MGAVSEDNSNLFPQFSSIKTDNCEICGESHAVDACTLVSGFTNYVRDSPSLSYARLTLPEGLEVREMSDGTKTVVTTEKFSKGLKFGPFVAKTSNLIDVRIEFPIKVFLSESESVYLETYEEIFCNWMCLVLPAASAEEQNMICFQIEGSIYFCSLRDIDKGEELRVWYAPYYAEKMGAHLFPKPSNLIHSSDEDFQEIFESLQSGVEMQDHQYLPKSKKRRRPHKKSVLGENYYREVPPSDALPEELLGAERRSEWECESCGQLEHNVAAFARHLMTHCQPPRRPSLPCPHCNVNFRKDGPSRQVHVEVCKRKKLKNSKEGLDQLNLNKQIFTVKVVNSHLNQEIKNKWNKSDVTVNVNDKRSNQTNKAMGQSTDSHDGKDMHSGALTYNKPETPAHTDTSSKRTNIANNAWIITEQNSLQGTSDNQNTHLVCANPDDKSGKDENCKFQTLQNSEENLNENLIVKSHLNPPILDLSDDIDFHLTKSLDEMINDDCNLEKSLAYSKNRSLDLFGGVESNLLASNIANTHSSSLDTSSFYSLEKDEFLQTDFATCNDVTDEERNRIVENLLSETEDKFFASDYEIADTCVSDIAETQAKVGPTEQDKEATSDKRSKLGGDFTCGICAKSFTKPVYLYRHLRKHTGEFRCNTCYMVFARKENLQNHRLSCSSEAEIQDSITRVRATCKFCRLQFYSLSALQDHMEEHYCNGDTWKCRCQFTSSNPDIFLTHRCPFYSSPKSCTLCGKKFYCQKEFVEHKNHPILKSGNKPDRSLLCEICGALHHSITGARLHRNSAHSKNTMSCSVCGEIYSRLDKLKEHSHKHENVLWECPVCSKKFKSEKFCNFHQKAMHLAPVLPCKYCPKEFRQKSNLNKHMTRVHMNTNKCCLCDDKFHNMRELSTHYLKEHQTVTFECDRCQDVFPRRWQLRLHKRRCHNDMYQCFYCDVQCRYRSSIRRHLAAFHKEKTDEWDNPQALLNMQVDAARETVSQTGKEVDPTNNKYSANNILQTAADDLIEEDNLNMDDDDEEMIVEEGQVTGMDQLANATLITAIVQGNLDDGGHPQDGTFSISTLPGPDSLSQIVTLDGEPLTMPLCMVSDISSPSHLTSTTVDDQRPELTGEEEVMTYPIVLPEGCFLLDNGLVAKQSEESSSLINMSDFQTISGDTTSAFILTDECITESNMQLTNNVLYYVVDPSITESIE